MENTIVATMSEGTEQAEELKALIKATTNVRNDARMAIEGWLQSCTQLQVNREYLSLHENNNSRTEEKATQMAL